MKQLLILNFFLLALLSTQTHSAPVPITATEVITTFGDFSASPGGTALGSDAAIQSIISSDITTAIYGSSPTAYSVIDIGFGDNTAFTGAGDDLQIFSLWSGYSYSFGLSVYGTVPNADPISSLNYFVDCPLNEGVCASDILSTSIELLGGDGLALGDDIEIGYLRLFIGGSGYNGSVGGLDAYSNFSLVSANYSDQLVVPLPLSAVLFSSGLALLGWIGRRKTL